MDTMGDESAVNPNWAATSTASGNEGGDVGENPSLGEIGVSSDGPTSLNLAVGPPSPLTGCYLLIVIGEPYSSEHKDIILQKLLKGKFIRKKLAFHPVTKSSSQAFSLASLDGTISSSSVKKYFFAYVRFSRG